MLNASNNGPGLSEGFPDVCLTPIGAVIVPIPYTNIGFHAMAVNFSTIVHVGGASALNIGSILPMTFGMEPGVAHPLYMDFGQFLVGHPTILVDGLPAVSLLTPTMGNAGNDSIGEVVLPGAPNVFYALARPEEGSVGAPSPGGRRASVVPDLEAIAGGESVTWHAGPDGVGWIRIRVFALDVPARVHRAMQAFEAQGVRGVVFDLRDNPGGELRAALELCEDFLPYGSEVARVEDGDGDETVHLSRREMPWTLPVTVFVDGRTASAAELFAGCLKAHGRAVIAGERTYGKGTGQALCAGGRGMTMERVVRVRLPGGVEIDGVGVVPDRPLDARCEGPGESDLAGGAGA